MTGGCMGRPASRHTHWRLADRPDSRCPLSVCLCGQTEMIEVRYQHRLERGFNPDIEPIRMTLEPLKIIHRPLALYMAIAFVPRMLGELYLAMLGFTKLRLHETNYWYRPATSPGAKLPLVFFHGVGPGVCAYGGLVSRLADDRSAVLVEIPHIAMGLEEFRAKSAVSQTGRQAGTLEHA